MESLLQQPSSKIARQSCLGLGHVHVPCVHFLLFPTNTVIYHTLKATPGSRDTDTMGTVVKWWHEFHHAPAPIPLSFLLLSSFITPSVAAYLAIVPAYFGHTTLNRAGLMTVLWGASSTLSAVYISHRVCFGQVCNLAKANTNPTRFQARRGKYSAWLYLTRHFVCYRR
jgi:hypothetical protein